MVRTGTAMKLFKAVLLTVATAFAQSSDRLPLTDAEKIADMGWLRRFRLMTIFRSAQERARTIRELFPDELDMRAAPQLCDSDQIFRWDLRSTEAVNHYTDELSVIYPATAIRTGCQEK
jgi:hypothetical protein